jgi:hypothetical protein
MDLHASDEIRASARNCRTVRRNISLGAPDAANAEFHASPLTMEKGVVKGPMQPV